jgi:hypothetical protein
MHQEAGDLRLSSLTRCGRKQFSGFREAAGLHQLMGLGDGVERGLMSDRV